MDFRKVRKWQVSFEVHRQLRNLPVPGIVVEEVQNDRSYRLDGRLRGDSGGQLSITLGGRGSLRVAGTDYELTPGKAFLHNHNDPQVCYYYPPDGTEPWNFLWMAFYGEGLHELISEINGSYGYLFDVPLNSPLVERLSNYRQYRNEVLMMTPLEGGRLVIDVIGQLCSPVENELRESPRSSLVGDVQNRIANRISERLDVESMARHFRVSREHLSRVFREQTGTPLHAYITRTRLRFAVNLLLQTRLNVKEIAAKCGYTEYSVFYRAFRKRIGMSPEALREAGYRPDI